MTFAYPVAKQTWTGRAKIKTDYDPLGADALFGAPKAKAPELALDHWRWRMN